MPDYYNWERTLSYDADVTMVIGARGVGKTFGLRKQCLLDYIKRGHRFVEVVRYRAELSSVADGYFSRLQEQPEFEDYVFRTDSRYGYIAARPESEEAKPKWDKVCYFVALTDKQKLKKMTFFKVRRIIFDEAVLDRTDRFHHYLATEFTDLADIVDTVSRERGDVEQKIKPRVYLLGNACDLGNPYFGRYHVETNLDFGYHWYENKTFLLHYVQARSYGRDKARNTVAGRMLRGTSAGRTSISNEFVHASREFVEHKSKSAKFSFGIVINGECYGIWADMQRGRYYVTDHIPNNNDSKTYFLTIDDGSVNYIAASKASPALKSFAEMYYMGIIRYDSVQVKSGFIKVLNLFGIH